MLVVDEAVRPGPQQRDRAGSQDGSGAPKLGLDVRRAHVPSRKGAEVQPDSRAEAPGQRNLVDGLGGLALNDRAEMERRVDMVAGVVAHLDMGPGEAESFREVVACELAFDLPERADVHEVRHGLRALGVADVPRPEPPGRIGGLIEVDPEIDDPHGFRKHRPDLPRRTPHGSAGAPVSEAVPAGLLRPRCVLTNMVGEALRAGATMR